MKLIFFILFIISFTSNGQVLNGTWTGNYAQNLFQDVSKLVIEFRIINDSIITGKSHLYYPNNDYELHQLEGRYRKKDSTVYFEETLEATSINLAAPVVYYMKLIDDGTQWRLQGYWKWKSRKSDGYPRANTVYLVKAKDIIVKTTKPKTPEKPKPANDKKITIAKPRAEPKRQTEAKTTTPALPPKITTVPAPVAKTKPEEKKVTEAPEVKTNDIRLKKVSEVQSTIIVKPEEKDSIDIAIYDNGEIDNDSITIYFNDRLLKQHFRISTVPYTTRISLQAGRSNEIKIIADNMGSIPPNTALMIINTKRKRYEVRLSSNLEKNAVVRFVVE